MESIPVHLITGFLGSGKTTFLNHWIQENPEERLFVIENEVGKINIDSRLVVGLDSEVIELTAGCLCCSLNDDLLGVLEQVSMRRNEFDRLVIETTGIADPETIAQPFLTLPSVARVFDLQSVFCLADAQYMEDWLEETDEARRQIAFADAILINKADLVAPAYLRELSETLRGINPYAQVFAGEQGRFPVAALLRIRQMEGEGAVERTHAIQPAHHLQKHGISTFTLTFDQPFDLPKLSQALQRLLTVNRHQIYRIKGMLDAGGYPVQVILHSVRNTFCLTDGMLWDPAQPRESKIVVIGKVLDKNALEKVIRQGLQ